MWIPRLEEPPPRDDDLDDEAYQVREVFAHFGRAAYAACVLEHGFVNVIAFDSHISDRGGKAEDPWSEAFSLTMGRMIQRLSLDNSTQADLQAFFKGIVAKRNWLFHAFWREASISFALEEGRDEMINVLTRLHDDFVAADERLSMEVFHPLLATVGVSRQTLEKMVRATADQLLTEGADPLRPPGA